LSNRAVFSSDLGRVAVGIVLVASDRVTSGIGDTSEFPGGVLVGNASIVTRCFIELVLGIVLIVS
jgi:hypothetical protein